jgi:hypothetical protein
MTQDNYSVFQVDGGIGKNILASAMIRAYKKSVPERKVIVVTAWPEAFINNPYVYRVFRIGSFPYFYEDYIKNKDTRVFRLDPYNTEDFVYQRKHLVEIWCDLVGVASDGTNPELFLTEREVIYGQRFVNQNGPTLLLQSNGGAENQSVPYSWARDLPPAFTQQLINTVRPRFGQILHVRRDNQPSFEGTVSVGDNNIRNIFAIIPHVDKIIGIDSVIQHAAAALNKPATVGWIANNPKVFGHELHTNIQVTKERNFVHNIDSYVDENDWTGSRLYECPYDNLMNLFDVHEFAKSIA